MKMRVVTCLCVVLMAGCAAETESVSWPFDEPTPTWKVGYEKEVPGQFYVIELIREGDDIENWKELVTIQNFLPPWGGSSPQDAYNSLKAMREKECPGATKWTVVSTSENSILYEWQAKPCLGWPDQHEIARILFGKYNRFVLRYTVKTSQMGPEQHAKWIDVLSKAGISMGPLPADARSFARPH